VAEIDRAFSPRTKVISDPVEDVRIRIVPAAKGLLESLAYASRIDTNSFGGSFLGGCCGLAPDGELPCTIEGSWQRC